MYGISSSRNDDHEPHQPALGLALLAEEQHVVLGENGDVELGDDGVVVADDAGIKLLAGLQLGEEVVVNLLLDGFGTANRWIAARPASRGRVIVEVVIAPIVSLSFSNMRTQRL